MTQIHESVAAAEAELYGRRLLAQNHMADADTRRPQARLDSWVAYSTAKYRTRRTAALQGRTARLRGQPVGKRAFRKIGVEVDPVHPPSGREYERLLRRHVLRPMYRQLREGIHGAAGAADAYAELMNRPGVDLHDLDGRVIRKYFRRLSGQNKKKIIAAFRRALGIDVGVLLEDGPVRIALERRIDENIRLIRTIPSRFHDEMRDEFVRLIQDDPFNQQAVRQVLAEKYKSSGFNLRRIVRDQTAKATGQLNQIRQQQLGIEKFRWSASNDQRVRPEHQRLDNKVFAWNDLPSEGAPGFAILCRCVAIAVLDIGDSPIP